MNLRFSVWNHGNGTALITDRRSGLRGLFCTTTGKQFHGDLNLFARDVMRILAA